MYFVGIILGTASFSSASAGQVGIAVVGVGVASYSDAEANALGITLQCAAMTADAVRLCLLQKIMQAHGLRLTPVQTLQRVAPLTASVLAVCVAAIELRQLLQQSAVPWGLLLASCGMAVGLNLVVFTLVANTSALTMSMTAPLKEVISILAAIALYGTAVTGPQWLGYAIAMGAVGWYQWDSLYKPKQPAATPVEAVSKPGAEAKAPQES